MKTSPSIHMSALDRLYVDGLITGQEYKTIIARIINEKVKDKEVGDNG